MWKWVTVLCVGMYVTLMAFGGDGYDPETAKAPDVIVAEEPVTIVRIEPTTRPIPETVPDVIVVAEPEASPQVPNNPAAVEVTQTQIESIAPVAAPITITAAPQATITRQSSVVDDPKPALQIWQVTGSRVNLRAEANGQAQIVGRTVRGDSAEIIELLPNGWAKVYIIDSGIEAFMSANFISPNG